MTTEEHPDGRAPGRRAAGAGEPPEGELSRLRDELAALRAAHSADLEVLRLIREAVPVSIHTNDLRTMRVTPLNADITSVLGYDAATFGALGEAAITDLVHPADRARAEEAIGAWATVTDDRWIDSELRFRHADGSWRWIASRTAVLERDAEGRPVRLVGTSWDVTERKDLESALARAQTLEAVGRLAGGVAHDFNNLLTVLLGNVSLAQREVADGLDPTATLAQVAQVAREASRLTRQLLTFASREVGGVEVIDLAEEARGLMGVLRRLVEDDVQLAVEASREPVWVGLQRAQLTQILLNLVINARDAMPRGGRLLVEVTTAHHALAGAEPRRVARLRVEDAGEGIPSETLRRIFEPFFTTKLPGKGTGLGLSTVYGIVRGRGGDIDVRSVEGKGTCFDLWLPLAAPPPPPSRRSTAPVPAVSVGATILVVEDNAPLAETCVAILGGAGYRVLVAKDGVAALDVMAREGDAVAAVLSDVVMPRLSGPELAARLAELSPRTRVVLWSGYPQGTSEPGPNVTAVLPKPVDPDALLRALARAVAASR
jgi:PAS domain S-box-containing protein